MTQPSLEVIVAAREELALDIVAIDLISAGPMSLPSFKAGAHIEVQADANIVRPYSLCSDPRETHRYRLGVLRDPQSRGGSRAICDDWKVGDRVRIGEPRNLFPLDEYALHSIFIAGGIGITPMLAMARRLKLLNKRFELHYCVRDSSRAAFMRDIEEATLGGDTVLHLSAIDRFQLERDVGVPGRNAHLYVCGPQGFMDHVIGEARRLGWQQAQIHFEHFDVEADKSGGAFLVEMADGVSLEIGEGVSIADALVAHGYEIELSCEQGICGSCLAKVMEGVPDHRDHYLTAEEKARNDCMTLCCSRAKSPRLKLAL